MRVSALEQFAIHTHVAEPQPLPLGRSQATPQSEALLEKARVHVNHYAIQSREYFEKTKMSRGGADIQAHDNVRTWSYFEKHDKAHSGRADFELMRRRSSERARA